MKSEFVLGDVLEELQYFNPIAIYIDEKLIWDDNKTLEEGWVPYSIALDEYGEIWYKDVRRVDVKVVECHHSILEIYTTDY